MKEKEPKKDDVMGVEIPDIDDILAKPEKKKQGESIMSIKKRNKHEKGDLLMYPIIYKNLNTLDLVFVTLVLYF